MIDYILIPVISFSPAISVFFTESTRRDRKLETSAEKILGWIGCAPTPLTTFEMEQALTVDSRPTREPSEPPTLLGNINFLKMCGPIIEVVDEKLQFVHFTVQE